MMISAGRRISGPSGTHLVLEWRRSRELRQELRLPSGSKSQRLAAVCLGMARDAQSGHGSTCPLSGQWLASKTGEILVQGG